MEMQIVFRLSPQIYFYILQKCHSQLNDYIFDFGKTW